MEISFLGMNCVRITSKDVALLLDPYAVADGFPDLKLKNDAVLLSTLPEANLAVSGMVVDGPGEYEIKGAMITGVPGQLHIDEPAAGNRATIYAIQVEGIKVGVFGNIAPTLSSSQIEAIGQLDVLVLPVGGHGLTLDAQAAAGIVSQLEPKYVVPTHYDDGVTKYELPQDKLEVFLKEVGANPESQPKLRLNLRDLPLETTVVRLSRQPN